MSVVAVRAGRYNTLALDAAGRLWVWGYDGCATAGQLPGQEQAWRPRLVQGQLDDKRVVAFGAGEWFRERNRVLRMNANSLKVAPLGACSGTCDNLAYGFAAVQCVHCRMTSLADSS